MSRWYLDTSAALKLLVEEAESAALASMLDAHEPDLVACLVLETEMRRSAHRVRALTQQAVSELLEGVSLYEMQPSLFVEAGLLPGPDLRSLDALHLAAAIRIGVDGVLTFDQRMAGAARELGIPVIEVAPA